MADVSNLKFRKLMKDLAENHNSDQEFAEKLGVSRQTLGFWIHADKEKKTTRSPKLEMLIQISNKLNMSIDYLAGVSESNSLDVDVQRVVRATGLTEDAIKVINEPQIANGSFVINKLVESDRYKELRSFFKQLLYVSLAYKDDTPIVQPITIDGETISLSKKQYIDICSQRIGNIFAEQIKEILLEYADVDSEYRSFLAGEFILRNMGLTAEQIQQEIAKNPNKFYKEFNEKIEV